MNDRHLDALEFIRTDLEKTPGPLDENRVAELLVAYRKDLQAQITEIYVKGTRNRSYPKRWEKKILELCSE